jgi:hypothetical protein
MEAFSRTAREYLSGLSEPELLDLWKRLRLFTFKKYGPLSKHIRGLNLDQIILDAIEDTFFGLRRWPPIDASGKKKDISLLTFLCQTIRSKVSHTIEQEKRKIVIEHEDDDLQPGALGKCVNWIANKETTSDQQAIYNQLARQLIISVRGDPLLKQIVILWVENPDLKPKDMAEKLGLSGKAFRNAQRRLIRKAVGVQERWSQNHE